MKPTVQQKEKRFSPSTLIFPAEGICSAEWNTDFKSVF